MFPEAPVKIFLVASLEERARRRRLELGERAPSTEELIADIRRRDAMDESRDDSPLRPAADAIPLDTTGRTVDEVVDQILGVVRKVLAAW